MKIFSITTRFAAYNSGAQLFEIIECKKNDVNQTDATRVFDICHTMLQWKFDQLHRRGNKTTSFVLHKVTFLYRTLDKSYPINGLSYHVIKSLSSSIFRVA